MDPLMRIVSITWARNEGDILEAFVRHHAALVDHLYIVLHRCEDDSEEMARELVVLRAAIAVGVAEIDAGLGEETTVAELMAQVRREAGLDS